MLRFAPDADETVPEVLHAVSGIPTARGYAPPPTANDMEAATLAAPTDGGATLINQSGTARTLVATSAGIYEFSSLAWTSRSSETGTGQTRFATFGAYEYAAAILFQLRNASAGGSFSNVTGPRARCIEAVGNFLMLADTSDVSVSGLSTGFGAQSNRWWCSPIFDASSAWTPSLTTQCNSGLLIATPGAITGLRRLVDKCVAYKASSIYVGTYVGTPDVWRWDLVSDVIGCASQDCVVNVGTAHYFIGLEDIYVFDGSRPAGIGAGVREWFFASLTKQYASAIQARHDPQNELIYWHYPGGATALLNKVLVYHYPTGRFGAFDLTVQQVVAVSGGGEVITDPAPTDTARERTMLYIDPDEDAYSLTGPGATLTLQTAWIGNEETVTLCDRVKGRFSDTAPTGGTTVPQTCMYIGETPVTGSSATMSAGRFDVLQAAKYHRFSQTYTGPCELQAIGARLKPDSDE